MKLRRDVFHALAEPTRRSILMFLASRTMSAGTIAENFDHARSTISKHIQILKESGLLESTQQGREIYYQIRIEEINEIDLWLNQLRSIWEDRLDNLEKYLEEIQKNKQSDMKSEEKIIQATQEDVFIISHTFEAEVKTLFEMWVNPKLFSSWLGPAGADMWFAHADVREGGTSQWIMTTPDGQTKYGKLQFKIIDPNHLLVYNQHFCDKDGNFVKAPFSDTYPDYLLTTVHFVRVDNNKTKVTVTWEIYGEAGERERKTFREMKPVMKVGWGESFDKMESLLKSE